MPPLSKHDYMILERSQRIRIIFHHYLNYYGEVSVSELVYVSYSIFDISLELLPKQNSLNIHKSITQTLLIFQAFIFELNILENNLPINI